MDGQVLKDIVKRSGLSFVELSNRIGILPQGLNAIFNSPDVKSGIVEKIANALEIPVSHLYGEQSTGNGGGVPYDVIKKQNEQIDKLLNIIHEMSKGYGRENNN